MRLHGSKCAHCGVVAFPPHPMCPACGAESGQDTVQLSPVGTLYTFSEIHIAPKGFATPYAVGYVDLPEGVRLFGQIDAKAADLGIGQQVAVTLGPVRTERHGRHGDQLQVQGARMTLATIAGVGMTRFGKQAERTIEDIGREAFLRAMKDAGVARDGIDEVFCGSSYGGPLIGQRTLRDLGMTGIPITNVENACSSGAAALREACWAVKAGRADAVAVLGVEKLTRLGGGTLPLEPTDVEVNLGNVMPAVYAMRARRYMHETGATARHLAMIAVKAHEYGARNPNAQFQNRITVDDVMDSRMVADPLTLYMCCPTGDGAAAVIVTSEKRARELGARAGAGRGVGAAVRPLQDRLPRHGVERTDRAYVAARL